MQKFNLKLKALRIGSALILECCCALAIAGGGGIGSVGGTGGASEITQILNNGELIESVTKQAEMVSEQVNSKLIQIDQYTTMMRNLQNYPKAQLDAMLAPYQSQITAFSKLYQAATDVKKAATNTYGLLQSRVQDASALNMDFVKYMGYEILNAQKRGGMYKQRLNTDIEAIQNLQDRANQLRKVADQTSAITGNVQGLAQLNQQTTMVAGELMEMRGLMLQQNMDKNTANVAAQESSAARAAMLTKSAENLKAQKARNEGVGTWKGNPWDKDWEGLKADK
jgi:type IV secretion system protein TrbJ